MIFELEWHFGLSILPSKPAHHILSQSQYAGARPSLSLTDARTKVTKVDALADIYAPISGPVFS